MGLSRPVAGDLYLFLYTFLTVVTVATVKVTNSLLCYIFCFLHNLCVCIIYVPLHKISNLRCNAKNYSVFTIPHLCLHRHSGVPRNFFRGGSTNSVEDRGQGGRGSKGGSPLVRGSGGSCNLVQEISFHIVKFS